MARALSIGGLAAVALVVVVLSTGAAKPAHRLFVTVPDATDALAGQEIRAAGQKVGEIASIQPVERGHAVRIELGLTDQVWPLPSGSTFTLRWGGTISYSNRYIALTQGPRTNPSLSDGQRLPASDFAVPAEFDQLIGTFNPRTRSGIKSFLDNGGVAFAAARPHLRSALSSTPPALEQASHVLQDLDSGEAALGTLIVSSDRVVAAANSAAPGVGQLLSAGATTFGAIADQADALKTALNQTAPTLSDARATLAHANVTLGTAGTLFTRLAPGVQQLDRLTAPLDAALRTLVSVGPDAVATLQSAHAAAPALTPLLKRLTALMPELGSISRQSVSQLGCIRPYTPDIVAFFSNWADWLAATDLKDRYGRANAENLLPAGSNANTETPAQAAAQFPGLTYGFPRPPGTNAGQPWFLPQCGAGPSALDPAADPEAKSYNPLEKLPLSEGVG